jgi:hypothetical protein
MSIGSLMSISFQTGLTFVQTTETTQTDGQQLLGFGVRNDPAVGGLQPTLAVSAAARKYVNISASGESRDQKTYCKVPSL